MSWTVCHSGSCKSRQLLTDLKEYTYCQTLGSGEAYNRLSKHWDTWISEDDLHQIAAAGMNHIRIPIGYWSVIKDDNAPYVQGAYEFLGRALDWANGAGLKVMIDLHGGKQLGFRTCDLF